MYWDVLIGDSISMEKLNSVLFSCAHFQNTATSNKLACVQEHLSSKLVFTPQGLGLVAGASPPSIGFTFRIPSTENRRLYFVHDDYGVNVNMYTT